MAESIKLPSIPQGTQKQQMDQLYSYLYRMAQTMNVNLQEIGNGALTDEEQELMNRITAEISTTGEAPALTYNYAEAETLKSLIIKTAQFVKNEVDNFRLVLFGEESAEGQHGNWKRKKGLRVDVTPDGVKQTYSYAEIVQGLKTFEINAKNYIKTGFLRTENMLPVYGVAIGKDVVTFAEDGTETYNDSNKVAELTADALSFYQGGNIVAKYTGNKLSFYIGGSEIFYIQSGKIYCAQDLELASGKKLIINTTNFKVDSSGNVTITGKIAAGSGSTFAGTMSADCITSGSIDASVIDVKNINASKITSGSIDASVIDVKNINASKITSGTMSANKISGGSIDASNVTITNLNASNITSGSMSAARITSGTMSANRISGGTLTLGGNNNENGTLVIKNASGTQIGKWDKDGISASNGSFTGTITAGSGSTFAGTMSASCITSGTMSANRISGGSIDASNVTITKLNASNITSGEIDASVIAVKKISASNITSGTMSANKISGGSIDASNVTITNLNASNITSGSMSAARITSGTMSANRISGGSIDASDVTITNLNASNITSGEIDASVIAVKKISASNITSGSMSAARITSGTMSANRISGGTLTLGGNNNENGTLIINNASGTQIGKWDKDGIQATTGTFRGKLAAADGTFEVDAGTKKVKAGNWTINNNGMTSDKGTGVNEIIHTIRTNDDDLEIYYYKPSLGNTVIYKFGENALIGTNNTTTTPKKRQNLGTSNDPWGSVYYVSLIQVSSRDKKHDIKPLPDRSAALDALKPVEFVYNDDAEERKRAGLIYEDTLPVMPEICTGDEQNKAINYVELIPYLLKEIQDLRKRVKALEDKEDR